MKRNIWIDTDPGIDDAIAIAAAVSAADRLRLCGISTVAGNQVSDKVTNNALWLTEWLGVSDCPVVRGARQPLIRELHPVGHIHGEHGLGYIRPGEYRRSLTSDAGPAGIYAQLQKLDEGEKVTIVSLGPMTNIALLVRTFPDIRAKIDKIVFMGGSTVEGNITATAEFNIWADPEAAQIVFQSGIPVVMCGLNVTMRCLLMKEDVKTVEEAGEIQKPFGKMLQFYFDSPAYKDLGKVAMHDSVPIMYLLHEEYFTGEYHLMNVSCTEDMCRGMTAVCDGAYTYMADRDVKKNVYVLMTVDAQSFRSELISLLLHLPDKSE